MGGRPFELSVKLTLESRRGRFLCGGHVYLLEGGVQVGHPAAGLLELIDQPVSERDLVLGFS